MELLIVVPIVVFVLTVWFHTDAFVEYGKLFGLGKLLKIDDFLSAQQNDLGLIHYYMYLNQRYSSFFTKLLICPFCLGFWIALCACLAWSYYNILLVYLLSMLVFYALGVLIKYS